MWSYVHMKTFQRLLVESMLNVYFRWPLKISNKRSNFTSLSNMWYFVRDTMNAPSATTKLIRSDFAALNISLATLLHWQFDLKSLKDILPHKYNTLCNCQNYFEQIGRTCDAVTLNESHRLLSFQQVNYSTIESAAISNIECGFIVLYAKNDGKMSSAPGEFRMKYTTMHRGVKQIHSEWNAIPMERCMVDTVMWNIILMFG